MHRLGAHQNKALDADGAYHTNDRPILLHPCTLRDSRLAQDNLPELSFEKTAQRRSWDVAEGRQKSGIEIKLVDDPAG